MLKNLENKIEKLEESLNVRENELDFFIYQAHPKNLKAPREVIIKNCSEREKAEVFINKRIRIEILPCLDCEKSCLKLF